MESEVSFACKDHRLPSPLSGTSLDSKLRVPPDGFGDVCDPDEHSVYLVGH